MDSTLTIHEKRTGIVAAIRGRFDYHLYSDFRTLCDRVSAHQPVSIDLENTTNLDSSALEMLLQLRERVTTRIVLKHPSPDIARILNVANFDKLFKIIMPTPA